jgi:arginase family enzyme
VKTAVICFPFDLFGSSGTAAGAELVADELREILADNRRERVPTRARSYTDKVSIREFKFEKMADYENWRDKCRKAVEAVMESGEFLLWLAGNHLGALPVYDEIACDRTDSLIVQFDAHLDIHNFADCTKEPSHGNFLRHLHGKVPRIINVGHRDLLLRDEDIREFFERDYPASMLAVNPELALAQLRKASRSAKRVYLDIDCDVFDTAYFPAAAQPVPFGLSPTLLLRFVEAVWSPRVAGVLISEFDPSRDTSDRSLAALMWLLEWLLLKLNEK